MDLHPTGCCFFFTVQCAMKNYRWDSPTKELGSRENHSFFSQEKMDVSTIQVQEHGGKINQTWPSQQKKPWKITIWLMFSHFGQLKLEFLDISWGNPMIITMSSSSHRRGWLETVKHAAVAARKTCGAFLVTFVGKKKWLPVPELTGRWYNNLKCVFVEDIIIL